MKKAFTLIELLVVIAIIAILAAILFPVFAQAKEAAKKTAYISNMKQTGTASQIYMADVDDLFPLSMYVRPAGINTWGVGVPVPSPANCVSTAPWNTADYQSAAGVMWANSMQPYMKNYQLLDMPGAKTLNIFNDTFAAGTSPAQVGIVFNGLLHGYNATAVVNNSVVPAFWHIQKESLLGRSFTSPVLNCTGAPVNGAAPPCGFASDALPGPGAAGTNVAYIYDGTTTTWQYGGRRAVVGRTDSSTKSVPCGTAVNPAFVGFAGKLLDPWAGVTSTGAPSSYWPCDGTFNGQGTYNYWAFFRPDRTQ